jgi:bifunctional DNase/RNase
MQAKQLVSSKPKKLALASESDKHILPIFIEHAEIPAAMKYQLAGIQHLVQ